MPNAGQVLNKQRTSDGTSTEQVLVPSINYINKTNISNDLNLQTQAENFEIEDDFLEKKEKEKSSAKKEKVIVNSDLSSQAQSRDLNPTIEIVKAYFIEQKFPELEAQKFFNYFSSIGWLVGGKTPMVDWQASAQNWMINSRNFNHNTVTTPISHRQNTNTTTDKNYSEPL